jgi:hypothetical protein
LIQLPSATSSGRSRPKWIVMVRRRRPARPVSGRLAAGAREPLVGLEHRLPGVDQPNVREQWRLARANRRDRRYAIAVAQRVDGDVHRRVARKRRIARAKPNELDHADVAREDEFYPVAAQIVGELGEYAVRGDVDRGHGFGVEHDRDGVGFEGRVDRVADRVGVGEEQRALAPNDGDPRLPFVVGVALEAGPAVAALIAAEDGDVRARGG